MSKPGWVGSRNWGQRCRLRPYGGGMRLASLLTHLSLVIVTYSYRDFVTTFLEFPSCHRFALYGLLLLEHCLIVPRAVTLWIQKRILCYADNHKRSEWEMIRWICLQCVCSGSGHLNGVIFGSRPSGHYLRSFCLFVRLSVCLCSVFLSRLWSDFDQTWTYVIRLGLVVSPRI